MAIMNPTLSGDIADTAEPGQGSVDHGFGVGFSVNGFENNGNISRWFVKVDGRTFHCSHL
jgi:hypothetical protein